MISINLYDSLFDAAILDLQAAESLTKETLFAHAIFYLEQSYEKCVKSLYAYYEISHNKTDEVKVEEMLRRKRLFGHDTRKIGAQLFALLSKIEMEHNTQFKKKDESYPNTVADYLEKFENMYLPEGKVVEQFDKVILQYYRFYKTIQKEPMLNDPIGLMIALAQALSICLLNAESFTRYPQKKYNYLNIRFLNEKQNRSACMSLIIMIRHFIKNVPKVVKHYDSFLARSDASRKYPGDYQR